MKTIARHITLAVFFLWGLAPGNALAVETITIGMMDFDYSLIMGNVLKVIAEKNFGVKVDFVPAKHAVSFKAMDQGKGEIDIFPDLWLPNNQPMVDKYVNERGTVALTGVTFKAMDGFCTTKLAKDKYGIRSVYDLAKPEVARRIAMDGDGKGKIWIGGPGWTSTAYHKVRARDYGLADLYELTSYGESAFLAQLRTAVKAGKVIVFACYAPHHSFNLYNLVVLEEPAYDPAKWKPINPTEDPDWYNKSYMASAFPPSTSRIAYSKRLETAAPELVKFLNRIEFGTELINAWSLATSVEKRDPADYAKEWVQKNKNKVNAWLGF